MRACSVLFAVSGLMLGATDAWAQEGSISGVVRAAGSRTPLGNTHVGVAGTEIRAVTDGSGRFSLSGVASPEATLEVRRIGYQSVRVRAPLGAADLEILLREKIVELDAVVFTGTPVEIAKRGLGNAVSTIDAAKTMEIAPVRSMQELLNGRAPALVVMPASGNVGTGARLRVRGASSLGLSNQPLLYVDGVRVNNAVATGPQNQDFGSSSISRVNDFNPDDIASIEIIKGPAAATLYGTEASNGVIQIITKRGASGPARWNLAVKQGATFFSNPEERLWLNYQIDTVAGSPTQGQVLTLDIVEREASLGLPIWRTGHLQEYDLSVTGGSDQVRYYIGGGYERSEGADYANTVERRSSRANVQITPTQKATVGVSLGYVTGQTRLPCEAGCGGRVWSSVLANPQHVIGALAYRRGFHSGTPEQYDLLSQWWQDVDRFTGGLQLSHEPVRWLRHRLNFGIDRTREEGVSFTPRVDSMIGHPFWGNAPRGSKAVNERSINLTTVDYAATAEFDVRPQLHSSTSVGGQYYGSMTDSVFASGSVFPAQGLTAVSATTQNRLNSQDLFEEKSLGFFVQEQLGWRNRLFLTAGLRSDDHSAFGANFDRVYYPKVSASWVVSDEPFWRVPQVQELRLRAAYGESGLQPTTFSALPAYTPVTGPLDSAAVTPQFVGNPDLGAERASEIELGLDATALGGRLGLEFTYFRKKVADAILFKENAPSTGYGGTQPFNAGEVLNRGVEFQLRGRPYDRDPVSVDLTLGLSTNSSAILDLDPGNPDPNEWVSPATFLRHQVGRPVASWFEQRVVSAEFDGAGNAINVMCDNGQGGAMPCRGADGIFGQNPATLVNDDAPDVYLGRALPKFEGAFSATITLHQRVRLYALLDFKYGHKKLDGNTRVRCAFFGGRCRENFFPTEFDPKRIAGIQSNNNLVDYLIDDAGFTNLREVSVSFTVPESWARALRASRATVSLAGRNLYTWTGYGGLEPEAMFLGGTRGGDFSAWEQTVLPQLTSWIVAVNLSF
jgi:TonB-linked SusC/RagA family outer membrane protein